jgi:hypothetical protein
MTRILLGTLAAAAVLLSPGALAAVPTDTVVTGTTLTASKRIYMLAADESHVAVAYESQRNCIESWDVVARKLVRFSEGSCEYTAEETDVFGLAVAGSRLAWAGGLYTLHDWEWVATATRTASKEISVFGMEDEGVIYGPYGDGDLIVFSYTADWERLSRGTLYRVAVKPGAVEDRRCDSCSLELRRDRVPLAVDSGRIATLTPTGSVELLNALGQTLRTFPTKLKKDGRAALEGSRLVVQQGTSVSVFDTDTGKALAKRPIGMGKLEDVHEGVAVYIAGRRVHLLRLADGRDVSIRPPGSGPVLAKIESAGLYYAYNIPGHKRPGRVTFVPFDRLPLA